MKNKRNSLKIITAGVAATLLALGGGVAFADQGSGGQSGQCGRSDFHRGLFSSHETATCEYAGAAFAYFAYDTTSAVSVDIRSSAGAGGEGGTKTISSNCVQYGGFYHYGYTDIKYVDTTANGTTENVIWGFGSIGNPGRVGALADRSHADYDLPSSISHVNKTVYRLRMACNLITRVRSIHATKSGLRPVAPPISGMMIRASAGSAGALLYRRQIIMVHLRVSSITLKKLIIQLQQFMPTLLIFALSTRFLA